MPHVIAATLPDSQQVGRHSASPTRGYSGSKPLSHHASGRVQEAMPLAQTRMPQPTHIRSEAGVRAPSWLRANCPGYPMVCFMTCTKTGSRWAVPHRSHRALLSLSPQSTGIITPTRATSHVQGQCRAVPAMGSCTARESLLPHKGYQRAKPLPPIRRIPPMTSILRPSAHPHTPL